MRVYWHDDALLHDTGAGIFEHPPSPLVEVPELHPENAERIRNIRAALRNGPIAERLEWHTGRHARRDELEMLHLPAYIDSVQEFCAAGGGYITQSTPVVARSWDAALAAAGTALAATAAVLDGHCDQAYALVRPPGHHAQPGRADGYCLFSNAALAAELVVDAFGPGLIVIACGQDASQFDPDGRMCVSMDGFRDLGAAVRALADRHCDGRRCSSRRADTAARTPATACTRRSRVCSGRGRCSPTRWPTSPTTPTAPTPRSKPPVARWRHTGLGNTCQTALPVSTLPAVRAPTPDRAPSPVSLDLGPRPWTFLPDGRPPAPGRLRLVQALVNTINLETGKDAIDTPAGLDAWL